MLKENIKVDKDFLAAYEAGKLSYPNKIKLALAELTAMLFPESLVYINANAQMTKPPCFFIELDSIQKIKMLGNVSRYEIDFVVMYFTEEQTSATLRDEVIYELEQHITDMEQHLVYSVDSTYENGIASITGSVTAYERSVIDDPLINKADKELKINDE